ncbi:MAG: diguanylate cyclase [Hylemonella sp.]|nr:diguanylate cyclase [Hylemonella sp.]
MASRDFSTFFELLPIGAYRSTPDGRQIRANLALVRLDGYDTEAEMLEATKDLATEWYVDPQRRALFKALLNEHGRVVNFDSEVYRHKTRERIWVRVNSHVVHDDQGQICYYEGTVQEITHEYQARIALEESERRFRALTSLSSDWYWEIDTEFRFTRLDINQSGAHLQATQMVLGKTRQALGSLNLTDAEWADHMACLQRHEAFHNFEFQCYTGDEQLAWHSISGEPMYDERGVFTGYRGIGRDVTERKVSEELIRDMAFHDPLTGLPNRRFLMDRIRQALAISARRQQVSVLLFIDLDKLKQVNDELGHETGDLLLKEVANRIRRCVRVNDTVARLGGDEFIVLLEDSGESAEAAAAHARNIGKKILFTLNQPYQLCCAKLCNTASVGALVVAELKHSPEELIKTADAAMYKAKALGGNRLVLFDELGLSD